MLEPMGVEIDGITGAVTPSTGSYTKDLSELRQLYRDHHAFDNLVRLGDTIAYQVIDYRYADSDLAFGTTTMWPGKVGDEYFMTRGHYHTRRDAGETYYTQSGQGILLLQSREGETRVVHMRPGICAFIPPDWAHRSINTGSEKLVFVWHCATDAGHDYGEILEKGMRKLVVERDGRPTIVDNPNYLPAEEA